MDLNDRINFEFIYKNSWLPQVELGNIPDRQFETCCRCHSNIIEDILYNELLFIKESKQYNEPNKDYLVMPRDCDKVNWMVNAIEDIFDDTVYGYQCMEDVKNIHKIFWNILNNNERKSVKYYVDFELGWKEFSLLMCAIFKKSFEYIEKH
jgi:hypothetical protein